MTSQALYNRWRGQTFEDILGQEHITITLRHQIRAGRIGHAYLFTGLRGTGKTSTARILAKAVNCTGEVPDPPCNRCHACETITAGRSLDLIEIDAASNRGIDEIRDLRDRVGFVPQEMQYKVYVIDEVHMLTKEAFNALLKTLEEPPRRVIFILCTTEPHRLPDTILSRCQRFDFRRASVEAVLQKLVSICKGEGIDITPQALDYIARRGAGSFRDAESLLDQVAAYSSETIDLPFVQRILGSASPELVSDLIGAIMHADAAQGLRLITVAMDQGADPRAFLGEVLDQLRAVLLIGVGAEEAITTLSPNTVEYLRRLMREEVFSAPVLVEAIRAFSNAGRELRNAVRVQLPLELALVESVLARQNAGLPAEKAGATDTADTRDSAIPDAKASSAQEDQRSATSELGNDVDEMHRVAAEEGPADTAPAGEAADNLQRGRAVAESSDPPPDDSLEGTDAPKVASEQADSTKAELTLGWVQGKWPQVITKMGAVDPKLQALLRSTYPSRLRDGVVTLSCEGTFHQDTLAGPKRSAQVEEVMAQVLGAPVRITCVLGSPSELRNASDAAAQNDDHLFSRADRRERLEQELRNHPAVKALEQRGAEITGIRLNDVDE